MEKIILFGAGRGSRDIVQLIEQINKKTPVWDVLGYIDQDCRLKGKLIDGYPVLTPEYSSSNGETVYGVTGVQVPKLRRKIVEREIEAQGYRLATLIHPSVDLHETVEVGEGSIVFPGVVIAPDVKLGKCVIVNYNTLLGIDLTVGDYTFIGPLVNITASCSIGRDCIIGASSVFVPGVSVGSGSVVGLGTRLLSSVGDNESVMDLPRKIVRKMDDRPQRVSW